MKKIVLLLIPLLLGAWGLAGCAGQSGAPEEPLAQGGVLDLSGWDPEGNIVKLRGEWKFFWNRLLAPGDLLSPDLRPTLVTVPGVWSDLVVDGRRLPAAGYGTYVLDVILKDAGRPLGLKTYSIGTAFKLWVDGRLLVANGAVGTDERSMTGLMKPQTAFFTPERDRMRIVIQVSNFKDRFGGIWSDLCLGSDRLISQQHGVDSALDMTIFGVCFVVSLFYLISFAVIRADRSLLWFGICCLMIALRTLVAGEIFLMSILPRIDFEATYKVMFLSQAVTAACFTMFLRDLYPEEVSVWAVRAIRALMAVYGIIILATPLVFYSQLLTPFCVFLVALGLYLTGAVTLAAVRKRNEARLALAAFGVLFATMVNDILLANVIIPSVYLLMYGLMHFSLCFILILSLRTRRLHLAAARQAAEKELDENARDALCRERRISRREREVIPLVVKGLTYEAIAARLFISVSTLRKHIHSIYRKCGVKNRMELDYFFKRGAGKERD